MITLAIKKIKRKVFIFDTSIGDELYFRKAIYSYLTTDEYDTLTAAMNNAVWERNDNGKTCKYKYFNERSQRLYLDRDFFEWCKLVCEEMAKELETLNQ